MTLPASERSGSETLRAVAMIVSSSELPAEASSTAPPWARTLASPQSITWTSPNAPSMTFDGFRSRWITPRAWAYATVCAIDSKIASRRGISCRVEVRSASNEASVRPLMSLIAKYGRRSRAPARRWGQFRGAGAVPRSGPPRRSADHFRVIAMPLEQNLDGDLATDVRIPALEDRSLPPRAISPKSW